MVHKYSMVHMIAWDLQGVANGRDPTDKGICREAFEAIADLDMIYELICSSKAPVRSKLRSLLFSKSFPFQRLAVKLFVTPVLCTIFLFVGVTVI